MAIYENPCNRLLTDWQILLLKLLSKKTLSYLDDDVTQNQYQRSRSFTDGLQLALESFGSRYKITTRGLQRPYWVDDAEQLMEVSDCA